jgi:serine/threonine protein kinase
VAPEVIELKGASTASDIWSLGCTIIELLTGRPPYAEIQNGLSGKGFSSYSSLLGNLSLVVMFHIVEDPSPPLPPGCSPALKDFFSLCFSKDPTKRPSAELLFEHPWLKNKWGEHKVRMTVSFE